jgi:CheY-like chemotaxis protein
MHQLALKQALLNLIGVAMHQTKRGEVGIVARLCQPHVEVEIVGAASPPAAQVVSDEDRAAVDLAQQLADLSAGKLTCSTGAGSFAAKLTVPAFRQWPVLAIDDNAYALQLLQRYASSTRYHLVGARDPEQALSLAQKLNPRAIVLDVMMPGTDGWELLALLRQHPLTCHIPVVVCTILTQEDLAYSLGASDFVRKPVTRQAFLAALDRVIEPDRQGELTESGSH